MGLKRTVTVTSPYTSLVSATAGNSALPVWQSAFGRLGASGSARTSHFPANSSTPAGTIPGWSRSKFHDAAATLGWGEEYVTEGVPSHPPSTSTHIATAAIHGRRLTQPPLLLAKDEPLRKRIVGREPELAPPGDPRAALHLGNNGLVTLPAQAAHRAADKARAEDALDDEGRCVGEAPSRALDRHARRHAGPGRRAVDLALGEHADVA